MKQALEDITVLDFSWGMAGSMATMVMSDFGAEVIKVEPPGGDPFRGAPAALQWNRGKKSVVLDLKSEEGQRDAQRLSRRADVVMESLRPGVAERLGIGYGTLAEDRPELVYCSITGFGPRGPYAQYKGYEGLVAAKCGRMMSFAGQTRREGPSYGVVNVGAHAAAMAAVRGTVAALYVRDRTGQGQKVETSLLQGMTYHDWPKWILWQMMIQDPDTYTDGSTDLFRPPGLYYLPARTKDGRWLQHANHVTKLFHAMVHALDLDYIFEDPRFAAAPALVGEERDQLWEIMLEKMQEKTMDEWIDFFANVATDVAAEPYLTAREGMSHPQIVHNGDVQEIDDPRVGPMRQLGPLFGMSDAPGSIKGPAPDPGQHTEAVLGQTNGAPKGDGSRKLTAMPKHPLEGVTVLDFATVIAGPLSASLLAELGARVIRVETLEGDHIRSLQPGGINANRTMAGAEDLSMNLKTPQGQEIARALVRKADILLHNMRPGAPERIGLGLEQVRQLNPNIIYLYVGGYGSTGPSSRRPAMHPIGGAVTGGALSQAGRGIPPPPETPMSMEEIKEVSRILARAQDPNPDPNTSMVAATAMVMGLYARHRFGTANYLEATMIGANAYANADDFFDYQGRPDRPLPDPHGYGLNALYRLYQAGQRWLFLACPMEKEWLGLCRAIGRPDLPNDPRFATAEARRENDAALGAELERLFSTKPAAEWERELTAAGVGCVEADDAGMYHFFAVDPHVQENGFTAEVENPRIKFWRYSPILNFSRTPGRAEAGPLRGQHTFSILGELGYTEEQIAELRAQGVLDWEEP